MDIDTFFSKAFPGYMTKKDMDRISKECAVKIFDAYKNGYSDFAEEDPILKHAMFQKNKETQISRTFGWSAGSLSELILKKLRDKEDRIVDYKKNTNENKQCLFMLRNCKLITVTQFGLIV